MMSLPSWIATSLIFHLDPDEPGLEPVASRLSADQQRLEIAAAPTRRCRSSQMPTRRKWQNTTILATAQIFAKRIPSDNHSTAPMMSLPSWIAASLTFRYR